MSPTSIFFVSSILSVAIANGAITAQYQYNRNAWQQSGNGVTVLDEGWIVFLEDIYNTDDPDTRWERENIAGKLSVDGGQWVEGSHTFYDDGDGFGLIIDDWSEPDVSQPTTTLGFEFTPIGASSTFQTTFQVEAMFAPPAIEIARINAGGSWGNWVGVFDIPHEGIVWDPADGDLVMTVSSASLDLFNIRFDLSAENLPDDWYNNQHWQLAGDQLTIFSSAVSANPNSDASLSFSYESVLGEATINTSNDPASPGVDVEYSQVVRSQLFANIRVVPEPSSLALAGFASVALLRRRRK